MCGRLCWFQMFSCQTANAERHSETAHGTILSAYEATIIDLRRAKHSVNIAIGHTRA